MLRANTMIVSTNSLWDQQQLLRIECLYTGINKIHTVRVSYTDLSTWPAQLEEGFRINVAESFNATVVVRLFSNG